MLFLEAINNFGGKKMLKKIIVAFCMISNIYDAQAMQYNMGKFLGRTAVDNQWHKIGALVCDIVTQYKDQYGSDKKVLVGIDCDNTMMHWEFPKTEEEQIMMCSLTHTSVLDFLGRLSGMNVPFFCLTAFFSICREIRNQQFMETRLAEFFDRQPVFPFLREWNRESDDGKDYYFDKPHSIMYSIRAKTTPYSETDGNGIDLRAYFDFLCGRLGRRVTFQLDSAVESFPDKGSVIERAISDNVISRPNLLIFIDDCKKNLTDIRKACQRLGIDFLMIRYVDSALK
jgi:hypothetical protein